MGGRGVDTSQTRQKRVAREQSNKYKPRTEQEQYLPIRHAGRPADSWCAFIYLPHITYRSEADSRIVFPFLFFRAVLNTFKFSSFRVIRWSEHVVTNHRHTVTYITGGYEHVLKKGKRTFRESFDMTERFATSVVQSFRVLLLIFELHDWDWTEAREHPWAMSCPVPGGTDPTTPAPKVKPGEFGCSDGQQPLDLFQFRL